MPVPIEAPHPAFLEMPAAPFSSTEAGLAEENLQARIRGTILMAISNKFGWLVLTTGNKSELATGYSTLYGDMAGGLAGLNDGPQHPRVAPPPRANATHGPPIVPDPVVRETPD